MWVVHFHLNPFTWVTKMIFNYLLRSRVLIRAVQSYSHIEPEWTSLSLFSSLLPLAQWVCSSPQDLVQPLCSRERKTLRTQTLILLHSTRSPLSLSILLNKLLKDKVKKKKKTVVDPTSGEILRKFYKKKGYYWKNGKDLEKKNVEAI